ncbi:MAG: cytochrome c [Gammaproteobacteria bacterium]|nr:cytochrome c [Gammaproteobacteria bacterium]
MVALVLAGAAVSATALPVGCSDGPEIDGALVYAQRCAFCHDVEGQVGAEITAATLASRGDEETLTRYLRLAMPYEAPGTMTDEEYRATARYLLETRGLADGSGVNGATREGITTGDGR